MAVPLASSASASRSLRMTCSGEWRMRLIESPPALSGENDSHIGWTSLRGAGEFLYVSRPGGAGNVQKPGCTTYDRPSRPIRVHLKWAIDCAKSSSNRTAGGHYHLE